MYVDISNLKRIPYSLDIQHKNGPPWFPSLFNLLSELDSVTLSEEEDIDMIEAHCRRGRGSYRGPKVA